MPAFDTILPADSVEFCPHPDANDILLCGTYKLLESENSSGGNEELTSPPSTSQARRGQCLVLCADSSSPTDTSEIQQLQAIDLPAVLDIKWSHRFGGAGPLAAIATSEGAISLHRWQLEERTLETLQSVQATSLETLCLSIDWNNRRTTTARPDSIVASLSDGSLTVLSAQDGDGFIITESWHAHDHEPWIAAWDYWRPNIIYSGGDDLTLKSWDLRGPKDRPIVTNKRFDAGVTTIQSHPHVESLLAVGSYDNTVRLFDTRQLLRPLSQVDVGGGVWRVKWHPSAKRLDDLLVACMHDGFKIVRFDSPPDGRPSSGDVIQRFDDHTSLAYGVDWSYASDDTGATLIASCSFYDHSLHVWRG
ncbi:WD-40 repeat-containing protein [Pluteus cervinus]|uniref:WD-40 repeat-containing protein n=1 Tax=Pluteus cervinus TaxID=181527 RepID=A0ACD3BIY1_9AGAR|nr:WD-40 repeat-containing protein [Pluteus cervinus]